MILREDLIIHWGMNLIHADESDFGIWGHKVEYDPTGSIQALGIAFFAKCKLKLRR